MSDLPPDLLRRILTNLLKLCSLSTRGVLTCVCKSWAGAVQASKEMFLSPDYLDGIGLLTQRQTRRFISTLSNTKLLRTNCMLSSQVGLAIQVAEACPELRVLEVYVGRKYGDFDIPDAAYLRDFLIDLLYPSSWALRLHKFSLHIKHDPSHYGQNQSFEWQHYGLHHSWTHRHCAPGISIFSVFDRRNDL